MNLEQLCRTASKNWDNIPDKKKALRYIRYQFELLAWKRNKLKLGAIAFDIKEIKIDQFVVWELIEIRYIRQDTTAEDENKLENVLKRLGWHWDIKNMIALFVVIFNIFCLILGFFKMQYINYLPSLAFRDECCDFALKSGLEIIFKPSLIETFRKFSTANFWMVDLFMEFCATFNLIF